MRLSLNWFLCSTFWLTSKSKIFFFFQLLHKDHILHSLHVWLLVCKCLFQLSDIWGLFCRKLGLLPFCLNFQKVDSNILFVLLKRLHHKICCSDLLQHISKPAVLLKALLVHLVLLEVLTQLSGQSVWTSGTFSITRFFRNQTQCVYLIDHLWYSQWLLQRLCCWCHDELSSLNFSMAPKYPEPVF